MEFLLSLFGMLIKSLIGEGIELAKREDKAEDANPILETFNVDQDPDDLSDLDVFDGLLDTDEDLVRTSDQAA